MAKTTKPAAIPVDPRRISTIAHDIWRVCDGLSKDLNAIDVAKTNLDDSRDKGISKREEIMGAIAKLSHADSWTLPEIDAAAASASRMHVENITKIAKASGSNVTPSTKTMETFIGEIKHAAHPLVREHFDALVSIRDRAWNQETEQLQLNPAYPKPMRVAYLRKYHALTLGCFAAAEKGILFKTEDELVAHAVIHNPEHDAAKVHKKIMAMKATLEGYKMEFPCPDLNYVCDTLAKLTFNDMALAQAERQAELNPVVFVLNTAEVNAPAVDNSNPETVAESKTTTKVVIGSQNPARGFTIPTVSQNAGNGHTPAHNITPENILDDMLGDNLALAAA